jgi:uncharacterized protein YjbI with pentapeptide repeats
MANAGQLETMNKGVSAWNQSRAFFREIRADLSGADLEGKDLSGADLNGANLEGANLRYARLCRGTLLRNASLRGANLSGANLSGAELQVVNLTNADLYGADITGANLQGANFTGAYLCGASLRGANLEGVDLSGVTGGLRTEQLAGADLTGARLPDQLKKLYDGLDNVKGISESARKIFLVVLAACLYCWLTIATTTDVNLITNRASSPLPIIQTAIPIAGFYLVAPMLVLCIYFYFHFYLQKLWEELGSLPAVFPDGRPLHAKVDPWLLNDLVQAHLPKLNVNRPFLSHFQLWISVLLAWWVVPITMFLFWGRYLRRHEQIGTAFHIVLLVVSLVAAVCLYRLAVATFRGLERRPFLWKSALSNRQSLLTIAFAVGAAGFFGLISLGAIRGDRSSKPLFGIALPQSEGRWNMSDGPATWVPRFMALVGSPPFASLTGVDVSVRGYSGNSKSQKNLDSTFGAELAGADLRYASARGAFLVRSSLTFADLSVADLGDADLSGANLTQANLSGANLLLADLSGANLYGARLEHTVLSVANLSSTMLMASDLTGADLTGADLADSNLFASDLSDARLSYANLTYSHLEKASNLNPATVKLAKNWEQAFYDDEMIKALGLPPDHDDKLTEQQEKEARLSQKKTERQIPLAPPSPKSSRLAPFRPIY